MKSRTTNRDRRISPDMDPADLREFIGLVGALHSCQKKGTNPLRRTIKSGELLDFIEDYPVFAALSNISSWSSCRHAARCTPLPRSCASLLPHPSLLPRTSLAHRGSGLLRRSEPLPPTPYWERLEAVLQRGVCGRRRGWAGWAQLCPRRRLRKPR